MSNRRTRALVMLAAVFNAPLAGSINRALIDLPAWRTVGVIAWADFSRHADLGNGRILYPLEAIGGMAFSIAALLS